MGIVVATVSKSIVHAAVATEAIYKWGHFPAFVPPPLNTMMGPYKFLQRCFTLCSVM